LVICGIPLQVTFGIAFVLIAWALAIHPIRLLVNRAIRYVGLVSYSMYIWHFWILDRVLPHILPSVHLFRSDKQNGTLQFAVIYASVIALSLIVATLSYYIIELPSQRMGKNLIARMGWGSDHAGKSLASRSA
jgi:peptidoglycan/LPS O-acetylase OafA/YrhL